MGLWKMNLDLDYEILGQASSDQFIAEVDVANAIFDLPNSRQSLMYFHGRRVFQQKKHLRTQSEPATMQRGRASQPH
jgi:hypothetical protein